MKNLFVCIITSENNNKQHLVSYFYKHIAFLFFYFFYLFIYFFFVKEHPRSITVHTFFEKTGNAVDETMQQQHLSQYINIYLHRECRKTSFIFCYIVTAENLI